jgi:hypothetical protein
MADTFAPAGLRWPSLHDGRPHSACGRDQPEAGMRPLRPIHYVREFKFDSHRVTDTGVDMPPSDCPVGAARDPDL